MIYGAGGGGIFCDDASPIITSCTIRLNGSIYSEVDGGSRNISSCSGGIHCQGTSASVITWCEIVDNYAASPSSPVITYSDVEVTGYPGTGNFTADPLFEAGANGSYYLSRIAAGQPGDSPCINAGDSNASDVCFSTGSGTICLDLLSTRTDEVPDDGVVDLGYHYSAASTPSDVPATGPMGTGILLVVLSGMLGLSGFRKTSSRKTESL